MKTGGMTCDQLLAACEEKGVHVTVQASMLIRDPLFKTRQRETDALISEFLLGAMIGENSAYNPRDWNDAMARMSVARIFKMSEADAVHFALQVSDAEMQPHNELVVCMYPISRRVFIVRRRESGKIELDASDVGNTSRLLTRNTWAIILADPRTENQHQIPWLGQSSE